MSRINIKDDEIWAHSGQIDKPGSNRFAEGNVKGKGVEPPEAEEHNFQFNRCDNNLQYILRQAALPWDKDEIYPEYALVNFNGKLYYSTSNNNTSNIPGSSDKWDLSVEEWRQPLLSVSGGNLNDLNSSGFYRSSSNNNKWINTPPGFNRGAFTLFVDSISDSSAYLRQTIYSYNSYESWTRFFVNSSWSPWRSILTGRVDGDTLILDL